MKKFISLLTCLFLVLLFALPVDAGTPSRRPFGIRFADEGAAHDTPPSGFLDLYVNGDVLYVIDDAGTATDVLGGNTVYSSLVDPTADTAITFADNEINAWTFADTNEDMFNIQGIGAFGNVSVMRVEQKTGNPTDGTVLEVVAADANVDPLVISASGKANAFVVGQNTGVITIAGVAEGTDAVVVSLGDITLTDGDLNLTAGDATFGEDVTITGALGVTGVTTTSGGITMSGPILLPAETVTATNVITAAECGTTFFLSSATEFVSTLPALSTVSAGCYFKFVVVGAPVDASYTILTSSLENFLYGGINELEVDTGDDGPTQAAGDTITVVDGAALRGDYVEMISDGTSWYLSGQSNGDGGFTITQAD